MTLKKRTKKRQLPVAHRAYLAVFFVIFLIYGATLLYPFIWALINAGKTSIEYVENSFNLPEKYLFQNFIDAFTNLKHNEIPFIQMLFNSLWMAVVKVTAHIIAASMAAYVVAKYRFPGKTFIFSLAIFIQVIPVVGAEAARYKFYATFGFLDNPALFWMVWASAFSFQFIVLYGTFQSISWSYAEAAFMDGASNFQVFRSVMLPQAKGAIGSLMILDFITAWSDYQTSLLYMKKYPTTALGIFTFQTESRFMANSMPLMFAAIIINVVPIIILFICFQKTILTNVTAGGLKG